MTNYTLTALYKFVSLPDFKELKDIFYQKMVELNIKGTLLLASEGVNGTVSGIDSHIQLFLEWIKSDDRFSDIVHKESYYSESPFYRTKVKLKKEIVTMGVPNIDPKHIVGTYVKPRDWNKLISDPNVTLIDTRNDYEYMIGTFKGAVNPETDNFREFPRYADDNLSPNVNKKVAMFCTGGIRCEKSTALLKEKGFEDVYHLEGGILKYLEDVPKEESLWRGECFVFDGRVSVNHNLEKGKYDQCYACRLPLTNKEKTHSKYEKGISCHYCYDSLSDNQKKRFTEREKQITLAKSRDEVHIGSEVIDLITNKKSIKLDIKKRQKSLNKEI
jgi:UPF0176 protein